MKKREARQLDPTLVERLARDVERHGDAHMAAAIGVSRWVVVRALARLPQYRGTLAAIAAHYAAEHATDPMRCGTSRARRP